jgi:hypothetical protein
MNAGGIVALTVGAVVVAGGGVYLLTRKKSGATVLGGKPTAAERTGFDVTSSGGRAASQKPTWERVHQEAVRFAAYQACRSQGGSVQACKLVGETGAVVAQLEDKLLRVAGSALENVASKTWNTIKGWF